MEIPQARKLTDKERELVMRALPGGKRTSWERRAERALPWLETLAAAALISLVLLLGFLATGA